MGAGGLILMRVTSNRFPRLRVVDIGMRFEDGVAEVSDPDHLAYLRTLGSMGVVVHDDGDPTGPGGDDGVPAESAKKAEWVDYAESLGVDIPEKATKADIIALVEAHDADDEGGPDGDD